MLEINPGLRHLLNDLCTIDSAELEQIRIFEIQFTKLE